MNPVFIEYFGYFSSVIIAVSMTMSSIVKFRWINLAGAIAFLAYGIMFQAWPVVLLNSFIISVDIFYLRRIYRRTEVFDTLEIKNENNYLCQFLEHHKESIDKVFPNFSYNPELNTVSFFVLRNVVVAGIFLGKVDENDKTVLDINLDFVTPEYQDHKSGKYIYEGLQGWFIKNGYEKLRIKKPSEIQISYFKSMGFTKVESGALEKQIYVTRIEK